jgi:hypothetical protein
LKAILELPKREAGHLNELSKHFIVATYSRDSQIHD